MPFSEFVGYLAMITVLVSFLMKDVVKLRMINSLGCLIFVVYGFLLQISWPIVITNAAILSINLFYLLRFYRNKLN